jgi:hypothetical protein
MKEVVADREWLEITENFELYYMYRNFHGMKRNSGL